MRFRLPLLLALLLLVPTTLASWSPNGATQEPSTALDAPDVMWQDPPSSPDVRVYFDLRQVGASTTNPLPHLEATLGVWRDCNQDGIMGGAYGATYPSLFLLTNEVCPPGARHNDGITVREVLAIGPGLSWPDYDDPAARVWADVGRVGDAVPPFKTSVDTELFWNAAEGQWVSPGAFAALDATGYAFVSPAAATAYGLAFPDAASKIYGEPCGFAIGVGAPPLSGWDCDPSHWPAAPRVGDLYRLRDTDCAFGC